MSDLISRQTATLQPEQDTEFMKLTVRNLNGRPCYSIIYLEFDDNGVGHDFEGYSSYSLDVISDFLKKYFMPSAQPETHEERTETHDVCLDTISRQAAIDFIDAGHLCNPNEPRWSDNEIVNFLKSRPSAQPVRLKGRWIERNPQNSDKCRLIECDQCGFSHIVGFNVPYEHWIENRNFCERCGADMRGEQDG